MFVELHKFLGVFAVEVDHSSAYEVLNAEKYIVCNIKQLCVGYAFAVVNGVIFAELCYQESGGHILACRLVEACKAFEVVHNVGDRYFPAGEVYSSVAYEVLYLGAGKT